MRVARRGLSTCFSTKNKEKGNLKQEEIKSGLTSKETKVYQRTKQERE